MVGFSWEKASAEAIHSVLGLLWCSKSGWHGCHDDGWSAQIANSFTCFFFLFLVLPGWWTFIVPLFLQADAQYTAHHLSKSETKVDDVKACDLPHESIDPASFAAELD